MTTSAIVRCHACGSLNARDGGDCLACGTRLRPVAAVTADAGAAPLPPLIEPADGGWRRVRGVAYLFGAMLLLVVGIFLASLGPWSEAVIDVGATLAFALMALVCTARAWPELRGHFRLGGRALLLALATLLALLAFGALYFPALRWLGVPMARATELYRAAGWPPEIAYLLVAFCPAFFEELAFRGYVMSRLDRLFTAGETLVVQAALFSMLHLGVAIFPSHFVIGLALGLLRRRTSSLLPGMLVHAAWNGLIVAAELRGWPWF